jgi:hypothetical protein
MDALQPYYTTSAVGKTKRRTKFRNSAKDSEKIVRRTVEYLSICQDPATYRNVVCNASDRVIKTICNAALNVERGDVRLTTGLKKLFSQHRKQIGKLTNIRVPISSKRRLLEQRGGAFFIPALIGAALAALAGAKLSGGH